MVKSFGKCQQREKLVTDNYTDYADDCINYSILPKITTIGIIHLEDLTLYTPGSWLHLAKHKSWKLNYQYIVLVLVIFL